MSVTKLKQAPRFSVDLALDGEGFSDSGGASRFYGADSLVAEGETLEGLIANATIFTCNQDGGEGPEIQLIDLGEKAIYGYAESIAERVCKCFERESDDAPLCSTCVELEDMKADLDNYLAERARLKALKDGTYE